MSAMEGRNARAVDPGGAAEAAGAGQEQARGTAGDGLRPGLALAFAQDTVAAALACAAVRDVAVVTDDARPRPELAALGAAIVPDTPAAGLNAALAHGAAAVRALRPDAPVAALNADLPALRPAGTGPRARRRRANSRALFSRMRPESGTTLLAARPGQELRRTSARAPEPGTAPPAPWKSRSPTVDSRAPGRGHRRRSAGGARPGGGAAARRRAGRGGSLTAPAPV